MSSQGVGHPSQNHGMKNTSDPLAKQSITESAGAIASDSLAAESYNAGGEFADNRNAAPSGVSGDASTLNTTDTSAATRLDPTEDSTGRDDGISDAQRGPGGVKYAEALGGQPDFPGATTSQGYSGGPTGGSYGSVGSDSDNLGTTGSTNVGSGSGNSGSTNTSSSNVDAAPSYAQDVYLGDNNKPKGKNLTEDENLEGERKTDYELGSKDDPGRAALQNFENSNASVSTGQASVQQDIDGQNVYSELKSDDAA